MQEPSQALDQHLRQLGIIGSAIFTGVVVFAVVVWYLLSSGAYTPSDGIPPYMGPMLNGVGLVVLVSAVLLPRVLPAPSRGASEAELLGWHKRNAILGFALREGAAFVALVGVLLTGRMAGGFAVAALALLSMAFAWPRKEQLDQR